MLLETALLGRADCVITGDRDLLVMSPFQGIPILTPAEALRLQ
jgi:predicted nucleic acid-binding protein